MYYDRSSQNHGSAETLSAFDYSRLYEWIGEPIIQGSRYFYGKLRIRESGIVLSIEDSIELLSEDSKSPFVAQALSFWEDKVTGAWKVKTKWYYRQSDLPENVLAKFPFKPAHRNEIFLSNAMDESDVQSILSKAYVTTDASQSISALHEHTYFLRCYFDRISGSFVLFEPLDKADKSLKHLSSGRCHNQSIKYDGFIHATKKKFPSSMDYSDIQTLYSRSFTSSNKNSSEARTYSDSWFSKASKYQDHQNYVDPDKRMYQSFEETGGRKNGEYLTFASNELKMNSMLPRSQAQGFHESSSKKSPISNHEVLDLALQRRFTPPSCTSEKTHDFKRISIDPLNECHGEHNGKESFEKGSTEPELTPKNSIDCTCERTDDDSCQLVWTKLEYPGLKMMLAGDARRSTFLKSMRKWYSNWGVRPDVVLNTWKAQPHDKSPTAEYWQDYKKVRIDWRERAGIHREQFLLNLQHYMRIDGVYKDTLNNSVKNIMSRIKVFNKKGRKRLPYDRVFISAEQATDETDQEISREAKSAAKPNELRTISTSLNVEVGLSLEETASSPDIDRCESLSVKSKSSDTKKTTLKKTNSGNEIAEDEFSAARLKSKHWWDSETTLGENGVSLLYPTSDTHQWSTHNGIEHRLMEIEFEDGNDLKPPKESLMEYAIKWRPDSLFRFVLGVGKEWPALDKVQGIYQRQESLKVGRYWYKLIQKTENVSAKCKGTCPNALETYELVNKHNQDSVIQVSTPSSKELFRPKKKMKGKLQAQSEDELPISEPLLGRNNSAFDTDGDERSSEPAAMLVPTIKKEKIDAEISFDPAKGSYILRISSNQSYEGKKEFPCLLQETVHWPINENRIVGKMGKSGGAWGKDGSLFVRGCMTLFPPRRLLQIYGNKSVHSICKMIWQGCFRADPERVAFSLFLRLMTAKESPDAYETGEELVKEFEVYKADIFRSFLVLDLEEGEYVTRSHYILFMEWFLSADPNMPLIHKILSVWNFFIGCDLPFSGYPLSFSHIALKHHWEVLCSKKTIGQYCFRFSKKPGFITVDYTCFLRPDGRYSKSGTNVTVASRRLQVISLDGKKPIFRIDMPAHKDGPRTNGGSVQKRDFHAEYSDPSSFVSAWGSRLSIKCNTSKAIDKNLLRWASMGH